MSQHFLLSAKARTLSVLKVMQMTDAEAFTVFKELRWGAGEEVACPCCGVIGKHAFRRDRKQWRCVDCGHTFSITSGTIFANHKLPLRTYLAAIAVYTGSIPDGTTSHSTKLAINANQVAGYHHERPFIARIDGFWPSPE